MPLHFIILDEGKKCLECRNCEDPAINVKGEVAKLLPSRGANANARLQNYMPLLRKDMPNADVNSTYEEGMKPFCLSALICNNEIVEMRSSKGANINAEATTGETALDFPIKRNLTKVVELLVKRAAKVNTTTIKSNICTPLHMGAIYECLDIVICQAPLKISFQT